MELLLLQAYNGALLHVRAAVSSSSKAPVLHRQGWASNPAAAQQVSFTTAPAVRASHQGLKQHGVPDVVGSGGATSKGTDSPCSWAPSHIADVTPSFLHDSWRVSTIRALLEI